MASAAPITARSRKGLKLSSIHAGKRPYPKTRPPDLQLFSPSSPLAELFTPSSPDILPEHISPTSPKLHRSRLSLSSLSLPWNRSPIPQSRAFWVILCFSLNFSLTISNKVVLNRLPLPYTITAFHALAGWLGTGFVMRHEDRTPALSRRQSIVLVSFSVLYTLNIVVSNASLRLVTVPVRLFLSNCSVLHHTHGQLSPGASCPLFRHLTWISTVPPSCSIVLSVFYTCPVRTITSNTHYSPEINVLNTCGSRCRPCVSPVTHYLYFRLTSSLLCPRGVMVLSFALVIFRTYGDYYFTLPGFLLTLFGTFLASLKGVVTNVLQSPYSHSRTLPSPHQEPSYSLSPYPRVRSSKDRDSISIHFPSPSSPPRQSGKKVATLLSSIPKLNLTPIQLLYLLSPLAFIQCLFLALYFGEFNKLLSEIAQLRQLSAPMALSGNRLNSTFSEAVLNGVGINVGPAGISADAHAQSLISATPLLMLLRGLVGLAVNAFMAFALNVVSFHTNRKVGALGMSVAGTCFV